MPRSKQCFKCGAVKPLSQFYAHPKMPDGHVNKCKECYKKDVRENRKAKIEQYRAYDRKRGKTPERIQNSVEHTRLWRAEDRRRSRCHCAVAKALRSGSIVRLPCEKCGSKKSLAHHDDYDAPLNVRWLCQVCHVQFHRGVK